MPQRERLSERAAKKKGKKKVLTKTPVTEERINHFDKAVMLSPCCSWSMYSYFILFYLQSKRRTCLITFVFPIAP